MSGNEFTGAVFSKFLAQHKLMGTRSRSTGQVFVPPRPIDPGTHREDMDWVELSGKGSLLAFTIVYVAPSTMIAAGYDRKNPYCVGIVQLDEGPKVSAQILGVETAAPEQIKIGMLLRATFVERGEGSARRSYLAFEQSKLDATGI